MELERVPTSIIKVIGIGGGGCNAVNHMYLQGIRGVDFVVCNTDLQSLQSSPVMNKVQLGNNLTGGLGAGNDPAAGRNAALESLEDVKTILQNSTRMVFLTAGMGGGTGTGATPVIAKLAREMDILTIAIVTLPFSFEGLKRKQQAQDGVAELRKYVDALIVINNDRLRTLYGNLPISEAFARADNVLTTAAKGIAEIITATGYINVDFEDVKTVMKNSGVAIMGIGIAEGENRAIRAAQEALNSPLLNDNKIYGSKNVLLHITSGTQEILMDELTEITDYIFEEVGKETNIIWGNSFDKTLDNKVSVILVATGFDSSQAKPDIGIELQDSITKKNYVLDIGNEKRKNSDDVIFTDQKTLNYGYFNEFGKDHDLENFEHEQIKSECFEAPNLEHFEDKQKISNILDFEIKKIKCVKKNNNYEKNNIIKSFRITPDKLEIARQINVKIKTQDGIEELERKPAFERRGTLIEEDQDTDNLKLSDKVLSGNSKNITIQKKGNSFLNDKVD